MAEIPGHSSDASPFWWESLYLVSRHSTLVYSSWKDLLICQELVEKNCSCYSVYFMKLVSKGSNLWSRPKALLNIRRNLVFRLCSRRAVTRIESVQWIPLGTSRSQTTTKTSPLGCYEKSTNFSYHKALECHPQRWNQVWFASLQKVFRKSSIYSSELRRDKIIIPNPMDQISLPPSQTISSLLWLCIHFSDVYCL